MTAAEFQRRRVRGTNLAYASLAEWLALVCRIGGRIVCAQHHYRRCRRLSTAVSPPSTSAPAATGAPSQPASGCSIWPAGPATFPAAADCSGNFPAPRDRALLVETRNRLDGLRSGRADRPRVRGPRFDPARLPDAALERLIQHHPDLDTVERLRTDRSRRQSSQAAAPLPFPARPGPGGTAPEEEGRKEICDGLPRARDGFRPPVTEIPP